MIIGYIISCVIASLLGLIEALLYSLKGNKGLKGLDEHRWLFTPLRILIFGAYPFTFHFIGFEECLFVFFCALLSFPFFHDGFYYLGRKWIDGAYKGFCDMTTGSSAKTSFEPTTRIMLLITGLIIMIMGCLK